jgi:hypothetical protein
VIDSLEKFKYTMPYSSELFGVYQPILGWRSKRTVSRINAGLAEQEQSLFRLVSRLIYPQYNPDFLWVKTGTVVNPASPLYNPVINSLLADAVYLEIKGQDLTKFTPAQWGAVLSREQLDAAMASQEFLTALRQKSVHILQSFRRESIVAGVLNQLYERRLYSQLISLFSPPPDPFDAAAYLALNQFSDPLENFDPKTDLAKVGLSPVGLIHLFRQYFFEFDSFLGPPVQHVWLSPGGTVELVEVSTRKTTVERSVEQAVETTLKSETSTTDQDEISEAVKQDNEANSKFGASVSANERWVFGDANETASVEFGNTQKQSREETHKHMRQQTAKLSSEIKTNFKSVFKTVTEVTDMTSKRYVLQNTTQVLVNYEMRRKMRRVGVQVQDMGTQLCWQAYVDLPGKDLGVAKLVHLAAPPDFSSMGPVHEIPKPDGYSEDLTGSFNLPPGEHTYTGWNQRMCDLQPTPKNGFECYLVGPLRFTSGSVAVEVLHNRPTKDPARTDDRDPPAYPPKKNPGAIYWLTLYLRGGHSQQGGELMQFTIPMQYRPMQNTLDHIDEMNAAAGSEKNAQLVEKNQAARTAYITAARDRIKAASNIQPRPYTELREEERIVVYRELLRRLMDVGVDLSLDPRVLHKVSELLRAMFDIDKMLYFVAPEWWRPRTHAGGQSLAPELNPDSPVSPDAAFDVSQINVRVRRRPEGLDDHVVGWGGIDDSNRDNYYMTEDSAPARLGSSLGWLLQLDGDNLRNAFLNAPWVKTVIPILPGKELDALNWLTHADIEGNDGLDDVYTSSNSGERVTILSELQHYPWEDHNEHDLAVRYADMAPEALTVRDALRYLAIKVKVKHLQGQEKVIEDLDNGVTLNYLPTDSVYEHGFDPGQQK